MRWVALAVAMVQVASALSMDTGCASLRWMQTTGSGKTGDGQKRSNMVSRELSGTEDKWRHYVEFLPTRSTDTLEIGLSFDESVDLSTATSLSVSWNVRGLARDLQWWDLSTAHGRKLADNQGSQGWVWWSEEDQSTGVAGKLGRGNELELVVSTNNKNDVFQIDYLCVKATLADPGPEPTAAPQSTPAPVATPSATPSAMPSTSPAAMPRSGTEIVNGPLEYECPASRSPDFAEWNFKSTVCGVYVEEELTTQQRKRLIGARKAEGCTTILYDSPLSSYYRTDAEFEVELGRIDRFSQAAAAQDMAVMVYYPTLEIITENGLTRTDTAAKEHPEWLQVTLAGEPNVFYGDQEFWLRKTDESAWFDPDSPGFFEYLSGRIKKFASETAASGVWLDVPIFAGTKSPWNGGSANNAASFKQWSHERGLCPGTDGCALPKSPNSWPPSKQPEFKYWIVWRHYTLANLLHRMRTALSTVDPAFAVMIENYPMDYDGVLAGLEAAVVALDAPPGLGHVWEIDSVSVNTAMKFASPRDFAGQLTMRKFARGVDRNKPSWGFSIGSGNVDAGFVLAGAIATGMNPLEHKAPFISGSIEKVRNKWYPWIQRFSCELFQTPHVATVGILHSSSTRDLHDFYQGCGYGLFEDVKKPTRKKKVKWWASHPDDASSKCPHLGAYRGASLAMQRIHVPFKIVVEVGLLASDLEGLSLLWLPTVKALGPEAAAVIASWVDQGGVVIATGNVVPASVDDVGRTVANSANPLRQLLGLSFRGGTNNFGDGKAALFKDVDPIKVLGGTKKSAAELSKLANLVNTYVPQPPAVVANDLENVFIEVSELVDDVQHLYVVNYNGMKQPAKTVIKNVELKYAPPAGRTVQHVVFNEPGRADPVELPFGQPASDGSVQFTVRTNQFALLTVGLLPKL